MYVVTGLTKMKTGICISVYDTDHGCYRRPIPRNLHFQPDQLQGVSLFSIVSFERDNRVTATILPHAAEDYPITINANERMIVTGQLNRKEQLELLRNICDPDTISVFGCNQNECFLKTKEKYYKRYYVISGTGIRSLGTIAVTSARTYVNQYGKVRINFIDNSGIEYEDISYVNVEQDNWAGRLDEYVIQLNQSISDHRTIYIRLSLARGFDPNGEYGQLVCFLQVSNVNCYNRIF